MTTASTKEAPHLTQLVELSELKPHPLPGAPLLGGNMNVLQGVKVRLRVLAGEATMTVGELMNLREDAVLKLNRPVDEPIDVLLDGHVIARGQLVAVGDEFGVLVTELAKLSKA
jgi:flagellar motor switch protein FliN/FliY